MKKWLKYKKFGEYNLNEKFSLIGVFGYIAPSIKSYKETNNN